MEMEMQQERQKKRPSRPSPKASLKYNEINSAASTPKGESKMKKIPTHQDVQLLKYSDHYNNY
jgi:hypothetical protein